MEVLVIKHISLNTVDELMRILPDTLKKDLQDDEIICPVCSGLGIIRQDYRFGIKEDDIEKPFKLDWYNNEYFTLCPTCYFGRLKTCKFCGRILSKGTNTCNCDDFREQRNEEKRIKYQETINKAKEIEIQNASYYMYDEESGKYFADIGEFIDYWWDLYLDEEEEHDRNFDDYFEERIPKVLWNCEEIKMSLDAESIIENACDELHDDARENICDEGELQEFLNKWCEKQTGTTTYYPYYREYVKVRKEWFD